MENLGYFYQLRHIKSYILPAQITEIKYWDKVLQRYYIYLN